MSVTKEDLRRISTAVGYQVPEKDVDDFTTLLARAKQTFETVSAMEGIAVLLCWRKPLFADYMLHALHEKITNQHLTSFWPLGSMFTSQMRLPTP